ncbi:hypothetical protein K8Z49_21950 [Actinomadura madurae]|uniref:hypothetical protein n=1 Tax=Actinomadura madurae TaxID=1993 RepID=UPI00399961A8
MADDPHIHVDSKMARGGAATRDLMASTFGLAGDLPSTVTTGCGLQVPYAMTSPHPKSVTCLPCREYASNEHRRLADMVENLGTMPGSPITPADAEQAAAAHRTLAKNFSDM